MTYKPLTSAALKRAPILVRSTPVTIPEVGVGTDSGIKIETYTENFLISTTATVTRTSRPGTNIADRKRRITNYITGQMDRLVFNDASEITTHLSRKC